MQELVSIHELKVGKRLGLRGGFLVFTDKNGYHVLFQSEFSGEKFYLRSQRGETVKTFRTLDAIRRLIDESGLSDWPLQVFGDFRLN